MAITDQSVAQAFSDLKDTCFGVKNDYFGLLYMEEHFGLERSTAIDQIAFGGNDYGVDGFHFDANKRNFYLLQFKYSTSHALFKESFTRLVEAGIERVFGAEGQSQKLNQLLLQIKSCIIENESIIDRVFIHFVFMGDPIEAEKSKVLEALREDLENKKYLIDQRFGKSMNLVIEFRSAKTKLVGSTTHSKKTNSYPINIQQTVTRLGPQGEVMTVGFVPLFDLYAIYKSMGERFFNRNIRSALPADKAVNRSIKRSIKRIVIDADEPAEAFAFNHNGVTLSAEEVILSGGTMLIVEPRLLNGAQTVTTFAGFILDNKDNHILQAKKAELNQIIVLCRIVTHAKPEFVTGVTISNNRQNPVAAWNLHANDMIQLQMQDKLRDDLQIYYERQEGAFASLSDADLAEQEISQHRAIELTKLARTFVAADGDLDKLSRFSEVFEDDAIYNRVFNEDRLKADSRKIVLCYKVQFRLRKFANAIVEKGANKYAYVQRARNLLWSLLCQSILNDPKIEQYADKFGTGMSLEAVMNFEPS